ncbi:MAG: hypothetical protein Q3W86_04550, partial [Evtepia sp.]|nr:hypothetical protein [Evtepia sp.]
MNRRLKRALAASFSPPPPQRKTVFLRTLPQPDLSLGTLLCYPNPHLRKRAWPLSFWGVLSAVLGGGGVDPKSVLFT